MLELWGTQNIPSLLLLLGLLWIGMAAPDRVLAMSQIVAAPDRVLAMSQIVAAPDRVLAMNQIE